MYILYDEIWTKHGERKHESIKEEFPTLESAQSEMRYRFAAEGGTFLDCMLTYSALIVREDRMHQWGILRKEA